MAGSALAGALIELAQRRAAGTAGPAWLARLAFFAAAYAGSYLLVARAPTPLAAEPALLVNVAAMSLMVHSLVMTAQSLNPAASFRLSTRAVASSAVVGLVATGIVVSDPVSLGLAGGANLWVLQPSLPLVLLFGHHLALAALATRTVVVAPHLRFAGAGMAIWLATGMVDILMTFAVLPAVIYLSPVGFLAAAAGFALDNIRANTDRLARSEDLNEALLNDLDDGVVVLDPQGRVRLWNQALAHMTGGTTDHMIGQSITSSGLFSAEEFALLEQAQQASRAGTVGTVEHAVQTGRTARVFRTTFSRSVSGEVVGLVRDVTDERQLATRMAAADRVIAMGTLAAGIGHEIANPLQYLTTNLDYVLDHVHADAAVASALRDAKEGATRIREVIGDLRALAAAPDRPGEPVYLHEVAAAALQVGGAGLSERGIAVELELEEGPATLGQSARLIQVVLNLITNAAKAVELQGDGVVKLRSGVRDDDVWLEVQDNGPGVAAEDRERLFDAFFTTRAADGGSGLGLAICQRIVEDHDGWFEVESTPGEGASFRLVLPMATRPTDQAARATPTLGTFGA